MISLATFAKIPEGHPYSVVLVSVPGTQEASDAVLLAQVPTTAIVNKAAAEAAVKVTYAGDPQFKVIETTSMSYAVNTPQRVILVGGLYYLCYQGVWFCRQGAVGPWVVVDTVPAGHLHNSASFSRVQRHLCHRLESHHHNNRNQLFQRLPGDVRRRHGGGRHDRLRHRILLPAIYLLRPAPDLLSVSLYLRSCCGLQSIHRLLRGGTRILRPLRFGWNRGLVQSCYRHLRPRCRLVQSRYRNLRPRRHHSKCLRRTHLRPGLQSMDRHIRRHIAGPQSI